jgi:hypothetical protein
LLAKLDHTDGIRANFWVIFAKLEKEATGLSELVANPDPMKSQVANELLVNAEKARLRDLVAEARQKANQLLGDLQNNREAERLQKAKLVPDEFAAEVRSVFRDLNQTEKMRFMSEAIKSGDFAAIAALVTAPPILSGLTAEQSTNFRDSFLERMAPRTATVLDDVTDICETSFSTLDRLARPIGGALTAQASDAVHAA